MKKGDILTASWGYEQTNVEFYLVVSSTKKTVIIQQLETQKNESGFLSGHLFPTDKTFGECMRRKICLFDKEVVKINSFTIAHIWDGKPQYFSAYA